MGVSNRKRRAAAQRNGQRQSSGRARVDDTVLARRADDGYVTVAELFLAAVYASAAGDHGSLTRCIQPLERANPEAIASEIQAVLEAQLADTWDRGWQPADLVHALDRVLDKPAVTLLRLAVIAQSKVYEELGDNVAPAWMAQIHRLRGTVTANPHRPYLLELRSSESWPERLRAALRLQTLLMRALSLPRLVDPPSCWYEGVATNEESLPSAVLGKVRALLAKAESTTFEAEAEAFTAKAQELMARHRIDRALLEAGDRAEGAAPVARRILIDNPYGDAKAILLSAIARPNGCQSLWHSGFSFATVFGFADELDAVEELFTSLLVQATSALRREGSKTDGYGRSRTTRFRRSFLIGFARRIGERLHEAVEATVDQASAEVGPSLLPVLAARTEATARAADATFPETRTFSPSATDHEGWYAGQIFADQANLAVGPELADESN